MMLERSYQENTKIDSCMYKKSNLTTTPCACNEYGARMSEDEELITKLIDDIK